MVADNTRDNRNHRMSRRDRVRANLRIFSRGRLVSAQARGQVLANKQADRYFRKAKAHLEEAVKYLDWARDTCDVREQEQRGDYYDLHAPLTNLIETEEFLENLGK